MHFIKKGYRKRNLRLTFDILKETILSNSEEHWERRGENRRVLSSRNASISIADASVTMPVRTPVRTDRKREKLVLTAKVSFRREKNQATLHGSR